MQDPGAPVNYQTVFRNVPPGKARHIKVRRNEGVRDMLQPAPTADERAFLAVLLEADHDAGDQRDVPRWVRRLGWDVMAQVMPFEVGDVKCIMSGLTTVYPC